MSAARDHVHDAPADHQQGQPDEHVRGDGKDVAGLADATQVRGRDGHDDEGAEKDFGRVYRRKRRAQVGQGRSARHRDRHDVVDHQSRRRDQAESGSQILSGHDVRAAARRVGSTDLAIAEGHDRQHQGDRGRHPDGPAQGDDARQNQDLQDLVRRVGGRGDRIRAEDREGELLGQPLFDVLRVCEWLAEDDGSDAGDPSSHCCSGGAGGGLGDHDARARIAEVGGVGAIHHHAPVAELAAVKRRAGGGHVSGVASMASGGSAFGNRCARDASTPASAHPVPDAVARRDRIRLARRPPPSSMGGDAPLRAGSGHCPKLRRRTRRGGRPATIIAAWVAPMSYATRRQVAKPASVSRIT